MKRDQRFGQRDWRMPNRRELRSLLSLQTKLPALSERHPSPMCSTWYSATMVAISPAHAWYVALDGARMFYGGRINPSCSGWCAEKAWVWSRAWGKAVHDTAGKAVSCAGSGQDGEFGYGDAWPAPRFEILQEGGLIVLPVCAGAAAHSSPPAGGLAPSIGRGGRA